LLKSASESKPIHLTTPGAEQRALKLLLAGGGAGVGAGLGEGGGGVGVGDGGVLGGCVDGGSKDVCVPSVSVPPHPVIAMPSIATKRCSSFGGRILVSAPGFSSASRDA
jgi:hypothetical protein